jgi:hypothetical protein
MYWTGFNGEHSWKISDDGRKSMNLCPNVKLSHPERVSELWVVINGNPVVE